MILLTTPSNWRHGISIDLLLEPGKISSGGTGFMILNCLQQRSLGEPEQTRLNLGLRKAP